VTKTCLEIQSNVLSNNALPWVKQKKIVLRDRALYWVTGRGLERYNIVLSKWTLSRITKRCFDWQNIVCISNYRIEQRDQVSYSTGQRFKFRHGDQLSWLTFWWSSSSPFQKNNGVLLQIWSQSAIANTLSNSLFTALISELLSQSFNTKKIHKSITVKQCTLFQDRMERYLVNFKSFGSSLEPNHQTHETPQKCWSP
jgi:hypothetical protein